MTTAWDEHRSLLKRLRAMDNEAEFAAADLIERLHLERDLWRKLAEARSGILVAYRVGGRPPGKHIDAARDAERRLVELVADRV